jgi:ABC-type Na+ efflux pump permease subunit
MCCTPPCSPASAPSARRPREANTLLTPVILLATVPILFMSLAIRDPGSPLLQILSWIPPFTPFLMLARAGSEVAWWEIAGTLLLMLVTTASWSSSPAAPSAPAPSAPAPST